MIVTQELLESMFHYTVPRAANMLGISATALKSACRRLGVERWPTGKSELRDEGRSVLMESPTSPSDTCNTSTSTSEITGAQTDAESSSKDQIYEEESARTKEEFYDGEASSPASKGVEQDEEIGFAGAYGADEVSWRECFSDLRALFAEQFDSKEDQIGPKAHAVSTC